MNTPYERHLDRSLPDPTPSPEHEITVEALAVHHDPSVSAPRMAAEPDRTGPTLAWVRLSELPTLVGAPCARRGIDLQAELTRRARRTPRTAATKAGRRISRTAIARTELSTLAMPSAATSIEELGL